MATILSPLPKIRSETVSHATRHLELAGAVGGFRIGGSWVAHEIIQKRLMELFADTYNVRVPLDRNDHTYLRCPPGFPRTSKEQTARDIDDFCSRVDFAVLGLAA